MASNICKHRTRGISRRFIGPPLSNVLAGRVKPWWADNTHGCTYNTRAARNVFYANGVVHRSDRGNGYFWRTFGWRRATSSTRPRHFVRVSRRSWAWRDRDVCACSWCRSSFDRQHILLFNVEERGLGELDTVRLQHLASFALDAVRGLPHDWIRCVRKPRDRTLQLPVIFAAFVREAEPYLEGEPDNVARASIAYGVRRLSDPRCADVWRQFLRGWPTRGFVAAAFVWLHHIARRHPGAGRNVFPNVMRYGE